MKPTKSIFKLALLSVMFFLTALTSKADFQFTWSNNIVGCGYYVRVYDNLGNLIYNSNVPGTTCLSGTFAYLEIVACDVWTYNCSGFVNSYTNTGTRPACCPCCAISAVGTTITCNPFSGPPCTTATDVVNLTIN